MTRPAAFTLLLLVSTACSDSAPIPADAPPLRVSAGSGTVELGRAFPLTVVRVWEKGSEPAAWSDDALAPLAVRLEQTTRREDDRRVEEQRRYRAYAFTPGTVTVPVPAGDTLRLEVRPALDPESPGPVELDGEPLAAPLPWWLWPLGGVALLAAVALFLYHRHRHAPPPAPRPAEEADPGPPPPPPHVRALERLARLRAQDPQDRAQIRAFFTEAAELLRDYLAERFSVGTAQRTTEELLALMPDARLERILRPCDLVKFAGHWPGPPERVRVLETLESYLRETAADDAA